MAPTEGRVAKPERRWDCRRGTRMLYTSCTHMATVGVKGLTLHVASTAASLSL